MARFLRLQTRRNCCRFIPALTRACMHLCKSALLYMKAFLTDPIGLNVRNRLCHGLMSAIEFTRLLSDRVIHVLLMQALVRVKPRSAEADAGWPRIKINSTLPVGFKEVSFRHAHPKAVPSQNGTIIQAVALQLQVCSCLHRSKAP